MMSPTASPNGRCRALSSNAPSTAATIPPPAATTPITMNCEPPANTSTESSEGIHHGSPVDTAIAPKDTPTTAIARTIASRSRRNAASRVRQIERIVSYDEHACTVRQGERCDRSTEHMECR
jgi:hypothetical protein